MIQCKPRSVCLWDFFLEGEGHQAILEFNWSGEQGRIIVDGTQLEVRKHGVFSGHWTLEHEATTLVSAQKATAFTRTRRLPSADARCSMLAERRAQPVISVDTKKKEAVGNSDPTSGYRL